LQDLELNISTGLLYITGALWNKPK
jgi:hypothetical protein